MRRGVAFVPFEPTRPQDTRALSQLVMDMHATDFAEVMALRDRCNWAALVADMAVIHASPAHLEAHLVRAGSAEGEVIAYAGAWRVAPRLASVAFFGRRSVRRYMPAIVARLAEMRAGFRARHGVTVAEAKVLCGYGPALRWLERTGGRIVAVLPGIGRDGEDFAQMVWEL